MHPMRALGRVLVWAAICCLAPEVGLAQSTGFLRGLVTDPAGSPLPGVTVEIISAGQGIRGPAAITDRGGFFSLSAVPPGRDYRVRAGLPGYASVTLSEVEISAGRVTQVRIALYPESLARERVEVRARPSVVSLEETTTQTSLGSEFVDALPILGRDYQDILTLAPGVTDVDGDGNPNIHGARDTDVITLVDGVSTTDPLSGKIGAQLNIESIQEIQVKTAGATAEFGRAQGGFADIVTKSGGNEFDGIFKFFWRGSTLDGDGAGIDDPSLHAGVGETGLRRLHFNDYLPFLSVAGPIVRDRAWFFVANEYVRRDDPVNSLNAAFLRGVREWREFAKLTWQLSAAQRLALSLNYDPQEYLNEGLNSFTREESGYTLRQGGTIVTAKSTAVLSPMVALETSASLFDQRPAILPNLGPDTNGDGNLWFDFNGDGFQEASERDPGEDLDADGVFDVFEDTNRNDLLDPGEDRDGDGRLTLSPGLIFGGVPRNPNLNGCEGPLREDLDCDGRLDKNEDTNGDGVFNWWEDLDNDRIFDVDEDRNGNGRLDDAVRPSSLFPYGELRPRLQDRDYSIDRNTGVIGGPYYEDTSDSRRRFTLRQDLSVFVPDFRGSHDVKTGIIFEREIFARKTDARTITSPYLRSCAPPSCEPPEGFDSVPDVQTISALLPSEMDMKNEASGFTAGLYVQDAYKPAPNLSLGLGVRFDRERASAAGYSSFDPATEALHFGRLLELGGYGNLDRTGILADPIFSGESVDIHQATAFLTGPLQVAALGRLTRHHASVEFDSGNLRSLGILPTEGEADPAELARHGISPQRAETFALTNNNLSPRLSFSWDPASNGRSKIFATWGRYFDKLFLSTVVGEQGPDRISRYYLFDADGLSAIAMPDHGFGRLISKAPPSATQIDRSLQTPFSDELMVGFEREIAPEVSLSVSFIDRRFRNQLQDVDVNHTQHFDADGRPVDQLGSFIFGSSPRGIEFGEQIPVRDGRPDLYIHNIFFNQVLRVGNFNEARYRGIECALKRRLARRWQMQASYTYSRAQGDAEDFQSRLGNDPSTVEWESGYLDYDQRHVVKLNAAVFLAHDWQVGTSMSWGSGLPYSIISRFFAQDDIGYEQFRTRYGYTASEPGVGLRFVPLRRNSERNDPVLNVDLQARKNIVIGRRSTSLSLEVFNLLNTDDLRIKTYEPNPLAAVGGSGGSASLTPRGPLQIDGERRFGRRFQVGFRIEF